MTADAQQVSRHYSSGNLMERLRAALAAEGIDPDHPTAEQLAPLAPFATRAQAVLLKLPGPVVLNVTVPV